MILQPKQQPTSFLELAAQDVKIMTNDSLVSSKRIFDVRKRCVYAVRLIVIMTSILANTNSAAKV